jgi:hypothetical protein
MINYLATRLCGVVAACGCRGDAGVAPSTSSRSDESPNRPSRRALAVHLRIPQSPTDSQRPIQILDEIVYVFDAGRETDQTIADAGRRALLR